MIFREKKVKICNFFGKNIENVTFLSHLFFYSEKSYNFAVRNKKVVNHLFFFISNLKILQNFNNEK